MKADIKNFILSNIGSITLVVLIIIAIQTYKSNVKDFFEREKRVEQTLLQVQNMVKIDSILTIQNKAMLDIIKSSNVELNNSIKKVEKQTQISNENSKRIIDDIGKLNVELPEY